MTTRIGVFAFVLFILCAVWFVSGARSAPLGIYTLQGTTAYAPDGSILCTSSPTSCVQEVLTAAVPRNVSVQAFCGLTAMPAGTTINIPAGKYLSIDFSQCPLRFQNTDVRDSVVVDTQQFGELKLMLFHCGAGAGVRLKPQTSIAGLWSFFNTYDLALQFDSNCAAPNVPTSNLLAITADTICGNSQTTSTAFTGNFITARLLGSGKAYYNYRLNSVNCPYSLVTQNQFHLHNQDAANVEMEIGTYNGAANDGNGIGTNEYIFTSLSHTAPGGGSSTWGVVSNAAQDRYRFISLGNYNSAGAIAYWGPNACNNRLYTMQTVGVPSGSPFGGPNAGCNFLNSGQ